MLQRPRNLWWSWRRCRASTWKSVRVWKARPDGIVGQLNCLFKLSYSFLLIYFVSLKMLAANMCAHWFQQGPTFGLTAYAALLKFMNRGKTQLILQLCCRLRPSPDNFKCNNFDSACRHPFPFSRNRHIRPKRNHHGTFWKNLNHLGHISSTNRRCRIWQQPQREREG